MRIVHAADLHIDSPLRGLSKLEDAPVAAIRGATRRAFANLVQLCLDERAALLLLAGDVFDGDWRDYNTGLFFVRQLARLQEVGTQVVLVKGNHDAQTVITKDLRMPANVRVLDHLKAETVAFEKLGVAVHGQSFAQKAVRENLAKAYPAPLAGLVNIGLLHTNATGSTEHEPYAPCNVEQLRAHGYDYWALGHVHVRAKLLEDPWVVYPGNTQGRHARETGAKGCTIFSIEDGVISVVEARELDVIRWAHVRVDAAASAVLDDLLESVASELASSRESADGRPLLVRVTLEGPTELHGKLAGNPEGLRAQMQAVAADAGDVWLEKLKVETKRPTSDSTASHAAGRLDGILTEELAALLGNAGSLEPIREELDKFAKTVAHSTDWKLDDASLRRALSDAEALLRSRLAADGKE